METEKPKEVFDLSALDAADTADLVIHAFGKPTPWIWTMSGPGHPKTEKQSDRQARETLFEEKRLKQAQGNGKKYKVEDVSVEERRANNVTWIVERIVGWRMEDGSPVVMNGKPFPFSEENARLVLADRRKVDCYSQALEFLNAENAFMPRSATTSAPSPSVNSTSTQSSRAGVGGTD